MTEIRKTRNSSLDLFNYMLYGNPTPQATTRRIMVTKADIDASQQKQIEQSVLRSKGLSQIQKEERIHALTQQAIKREQEYKTTIQVKKTRALVGGLISNQTRTKIGSSAQHFSQILLYTLAKQFDPTLNLVQHQRATSAYLAALIQRNAIEKRVNHVIARRALMISSALILIVPMLLSTVTNLCEQALARLLLLQGIPRFDRVTKNATLCENSILIARSSAQCLLVLIYGGVRLANAIISTLVAPVSTYQKNRKNSKLLSRVSAASSIVTLSAAAVSCAVVSIPAFALALCIEIAATTPTILYTIGSALTCVSSLFTKSVSRIKSTQNCQQPSCKRTVMSTAMI